MTVRLARPQIPAEAIEAVGDVLRSGNLVQGAAVQAFEQAVAAYVGVEHAVAVSSGTAAIHLGLLALEIGRGDEVIVPDFTFPATANVVELVGATPVLVDIDLETFNVDAMAVRASITSRTKAVIPVHLFGQPADMDPILELARAHRLAVLEDAACALGAVYRGRRCGAMGTLGCFSFHPRKLITTGEGGMVVTQDRALADRVRQLRNHGLAWINGGSVLERAGLNYRMTEFQGALGLAQMKGLEQIIATHAELADRYHRALRDLDCLALPRTLEGVRHVWQSYVVRLRESLSRDGLLAHLKTHGIEATFGTYALSLQPHFRDQDKLLPNARRASEQSLSLPLHARLEALEFDEVVRCLREGLLAVQ